MMLCLVLSQKVLWKWLLPVCLNVLDVCVVAVVRVREDLYRMSIGRCCKMSANSVDYAKMFGAICDDAKIMSRCACVACNSCTCACSCRKNPENTNEIEW